MFVRLVIDIFSSVACAPSLREVIMRKNKRKRLGSLSSESSHDKKRIIDANISQREIKARREETHHSSHTEMHGEGGDTSQPIIPSQHRNKDCPHCGTHFASPEAYQYHKSVKTQNQHSRTIPYKDFNKNVHHIICPEMNCCFSTKEPKNMKVYFGYKIFLLSFNFYHLVTHNEAPSKKPERSLHSYIKFIC